jgi:hypothetical protein
MATRTLKLDISFKELLAVVDQLELDEKMFLRRKLDNEKVPSWQKRFGRALQQLGNKNKRFTAKEVLTDVEQAISDVRKNA